MQASWWPLAGKPQVTVTCLDSGDLCQFVQLSCNRAMSDMSLAMCLYLCRHIIEILRMADSDVPSAGKIYAACQNLHETAKTFSGLTAPRRTVVKNLVRARWDMLTTDIHLAGYVLDPEFLPHDVTKNEVSFCMRQPFLCTNTATALLESALILAYCRR